MQSRRLTWVRPSPDSGSDQAEAKNCESRVANDVRGSLRSRRVMVVLSRGAYGAAEGLSREFFEECLSTEWFRSRAEARVIIESWRHHYNDDRPHSNFGYRTPKQFKDEQ